MCGAKQRLEGFPCLFVCHYEDFSVVVDDVEKQLLSAKLALFVRRLASR